MRPYSVRYLIIIATLLWLVAGGATALAQGPETVIITTPSQGETVAGIVEVTGVVDFPDFVKYEMFLKTGDNLMWGATVYAPVVNGLLARLDTRTVPDGSYQIVVRTVHGDSNYNEYLGPIFTVQNDLGAPLPHAEVQPSPLYTPYSGALARVQNCSGLDLEFDYTSPDGFCSADDLWIMAKPQDATLCTTVDVLLIPCEYRGTAWGSGEAKARTYSFQAEHGTIYEITYAGGVNLFINPVPGDERAPTDTAGLDVSDPARAQAVTDARAAAGLPQAQGAASTAESVLPVSGRAAVTAGLPVILAAGGLIMLMVIGGVVAIRRGKLNA
ncbi:MAG: hypothetical protein H6631_15025 [Anaerolineaceae bacterium]|nr:hypothetical protein [Anaerolineaceae bacterium]MCB9099027.1 hypothetical protein [Anaerolineales bacterium]